MSRTLFAICLLCIAFVAVVGVLQLLRGADCMGQPTFTMAGKVPVFVPAVMQECKK